MGLFEHLDSKKLVGENPITWFYQTEMTDSATKYAREKWSLKDLFCLKTISKETAEEDYVVIKSKGKKQEIIYSTKGYDALCCWLDVMGFSREK